MPTFKENTNFKLKGWSAFTKNTDVDEVLVEGQKDATETVFGEGDKAKVNAANTIANESAKHSEESMEEAKNAIKTIVTGGVA